MATSDCGIGPRGKSGPASEAIRAMGTNALPYLFAYIKHRDSPLKMKCFGLVQKQHWLKLPPYRENRYFSPVLLALKTLGPDANPLVHELLKVFENPDTFKEGGLALFSIGPDSIPALEQACRNSNVLVRADAALFIAERKGSTARLCPPHAARVRPAVATTDESACPPARYCLSQILAVTKRQSLHGPR